MSEPHNRINRLKLAQLDINQRRHDLDPQAIVMAPNVFGGTDTVPVFVRTGYRQFRPRRSLQWGSSVRAGNRDVTQRGIRCHISRFGPRPSSRNIYCAQRQAPSKRKKSVKTAPPSGSSPIPTLPPWAFIISFTIASPSPAPWPIAFFPRQKRWNTFSLS